MAEMRSKVIIIDYVNNDYGSVISLIYYYKLIYFC